MFSIPRGHWVQPSSLELKAAGFEARAGLMIARSILYVDLYRSLYTLAPSDIKLIAD